ncbi:MULTISPECIES: helix-turn-helix domain-containing protein [unclassified Clostridium]|uniref:AraC family transcriptional regulator n=1 Tax=unclassified Clostridium TaxID=2614128 RepID=UPI0002972B6C|nr:MULTISPECIES: helix-turn-helix domain-containing protein [unclassified Clostridium]EKQ50741.1 MAG: DNA-binding domain-containing protein, AraC-type [Clostridium sp. Maddingley MBC34-26]
MNILDLKEDRIHGNFILPFSVYHCQINDNVSHSIVTHWHEEIEIIIVEKGTAEFKVDLDSYFLKEGDILIIKPFSLHSIYPVDDMYCTWNVMVFNLGMLNSSITDGCLIKYFAPIFNNEHQLPLLIDESNSGYSEIINSTQDIVDCFNAKKPAFELRIKSLLFYFFSLLYENNLVLQKKNASLTNEATEKIKTTLNYIHENYMHDLPITDIANTCNLSQYYFMKFFKKNLGITCTEYINVYRLDIASKLLNTTDKSITEISFETGFNSVSYFNKLFKEKFKITPKEFRIANKI